MTHWKWIEDLAESGVPVSVGCKDGKWFVEIGGHVRAKDAASAKEAISQAIANQAKVGAKAVVELEKTKQKLATLNAALREAA